MLSMYKNNLRFLYVLIITHLIFISTLWCRHHYCLPEADEQTGSWRDSVTCWHTVELGLDSRFVLFQIPYCTSNLHTDILPPRQLESNDPDHAILAPPLCNAFLDSLMPLCKAHTRHCHCRSPVVWSQPPPLQLSLTFLVRVPHVQKDQTFCLA